MNPAVDNAEPERSARLRAMGGVLRAVTSEERGEGWGQSVAATDEADAGELALRREVPPHHGA